MSALPAALARGGFEIRMKAILADARPGTRNGSKVYIAAPSSAPPMVKVMFAQTGAQVFIFAPRIPVPQRLKRLKQDLSGR